MGRHFNITDEMFINEVSKEFNIDNTLLTNFITEFNTILKPEMKNNTSLI